MTTLHDLRYREAGSQQAHRTVLSDCFRQRDPSSELLLGTFKLAQKEPALASIPMSPRTSFTRVELIRNLDLTFAIFQTGFIVSCEHAVFTQELVARSLSEKDVVLFAKLNRTSCPTICLRVQAVVLIGTRCEGVNL